MGLLQIDLDRMKMDTTALSWFLAGAAAIIIIGGLIMLTSKTSFSVFVPPIDQAAIDIELKPGEAVAPTPTSPTRITQNGHYVTVVNYTGTRFTPQLVTIFVGEEVRFVNKDNLTMRIVSNDIQGAELYTGFDQEQSVGRGGMFQFLFDKPGVWAYHNLNGDKGVVGVIYVLEKP